MVFQKAKWIWLCEPETENQYGEFWDTFDWETGAVSAYLSVCGDYTLYVNGQFAGSNQFGDYPHYKIYDTLDITSFLRKGENRICVLAWYFGVSSQRHHTPHPGLIFEVQKEETVLCASTSKTKARISPAYQNGEMQKITPQLGYSFFYDKNKEDAWLTESVLGFTNAKETEGADTLISRPTKRLQLLPRKDGVVTQKDSYRLVDFGTEISGLLSLSLVAEHEGIVRISYGELLENGRVKRIIDQRDFSVCIKTKPGENDFTNYMLRFACRYMEIESEYPIDIRHIGLIPQVYPTKEKTVILEQKADSRIYEGCLNTLKLCMMEHYVDCPWREQCLYTYDSRNQMLAGYFAYEDKNQAYARANLLLMSQDKREDGLLSLCFPSAEELTIPSFSLYYILAVAEYMEYTGDDSLGEEVFSKMEEILTAYSGNRKDGLICIFQGAQYWNFYDWSEHCVGNYKVDGGTDPDFVINAIAVLVLGAFDRICKRLHKENAFSDLRSSLIQHARKRFYCEKDGLFYMKSFEEQPHELVNSLAVLSGIATKEEAERICKQLAENKLSPCSFSMKCMKYDALLSVNEAYKEQILEEIRAAYLPMLDVGDTVWETALGAEDFDNAGSLCHGWSSIPIYYYHKLCK